MTKPTDLDRPAKRAFVEMNLMKVSPLAQRTLKPQWVATMVADFNLDALGVITVNHRDGSYYIVDGMHRVAALRDLGFACEQVECDVYEGLTLEGEADLFLELNNRLAVDRLTTFRIGVTAGRPLETEIDEIVRTEKLCVSRDRVPGAIGAVGTLMRIHKRAGGEVLRRSLRITADSFGDMGLISPVIDGVALVCQRYNGELDDSRAVEVLSGVRGGVNTVVSRANQLHNSTGQKVGECVAEAVVEALNRGRGGHKLSKFFKGGEEG